MTHLLRVCLVALLFASPVLAQSADATGTWAVTVNAPDRAHQATLELVQKGDTLTGSIKGAEGALAITGTIKGADVSIAFTYGDTPVTLTGKLSGDAIGGPATFGDEKGDWTGKRTPAGAAAAGSGPQGSVDVSGPWIFDVTSPAGTGSPTMTFIQSGEKLSGTYAGQFGEAPLQGTVKGNEISFTIDVTVEDMKLHIGYSGTLTKDTIKGVVSFGDLGEGTFSARRK
jgi:hypothetical protein